MLLRQGRYREALEIALPPDDRYAGWFRECLTRRPPSAPGPLPEELRKEILAIPDSEPKYSFSTFVALCGDRESALRLLRGAVEANFCGYPAMDRDPLFASIRSTPEFAEIRKMGMACQQRFLSHRASSKN
jgi:hypothetical protein